MTSTPSLDQPNHRRQRSSNQGAHELMSTHRFSALPGPRFVWFSVFIVVAVLGACGQSVAINHIRELRTIQVEFNQAATLDNQEHLAQSPSQAIAIGAQVTASYRAVLAGLTDLLANSAAQLQADHLLGTTYVLKALTEWRLGDYNAAIATVSKLEEPGMVLQARDEAIVRSFRGLIMNDQAYDHMQAKSATYAEIKDLLQASITAFQNGIDALPPDHGMRMYLVLAQLGAIKNWVDLSGEPKRYSSDGVGPKPGAEIGEICTAFKPVLATYQSEMALAKTRDADAGARLAGQWNRALQVDTIAAACP